MSIHHASPVQSPPIVNMQGFTGIQAVNGVPVMPYNTVLAPSTPHVNAFSGPADSIQQVRGMPSVGSQAPHWKAKAVIDGRIKDIELSRFAQNREWLILIFIPMAWSFICPTEIRAFDRRIQEFETRSCAVVFCSTDSEYVLRAWNHTPEDEGGLGGVHVAMISDRSHRISRDYGVLVEAEGVAQRAMFIIDPRSVIRQVTTNDANVGRSVDEARRLIDALEFTDEFGEGCPVDWKKGDAGVNMDGEFSRKRGSSGTQRGSVNSRQANRSASISQRPPHTRTNTWSGNLGWLAGRSSASTTPANVPSSPMSPSHNQARDGNMSMNVGNKWAAQQNAQHRLAPIEDGQETPNHQMHSRQMGSMGGYFDSVVSPLEQPATVLNQMMHSAH